MGGGREGEVCGLPSVFSAECVVAQSYCAVLAKKPESARYPRPIRGNVSTL
jgi:hypothetical protein